MIYWFPFLALKSTDLKRDVTSMLIIDYVMRSTTGGSAYIFTFIGGTLLLTARDV